MSEPDARTKVLAGGRASLASGAWADAYADLSAANAMAPLEPEDLERLAEAAYLLGKEADSVDALARAHNELLSRGDAPGAARSAFLVAFQLFGRGERARGGGWLARARRALEDGAHDCAERGYVLLLDSLQRLGAGDAAGAYTTFAEAADVGQRFGDADLTTLARLGQGQALVRSGETTRGVSLLDEVMVGVTAGEVSPIFAGIVYCAVIEVCHAIYDLRRAHEWTRALSQWCESQPDLVPYRGQCLVRRAEIMRLHGAWPDALEAAEQAGDWLARPPGQAAVGAALYQQAELHRLRGQLDRAEEAYRRASQAGRSPQPGLAQLRLAQGKVAAAEAAIRSVLDATRDPRTRAGVLPACVEVLLAAGDVAGARAAADELSEMAEELEAPFLRASSAQAKGSVLLAGNEPGAALGPLRDSCAIWRELEAPYETARVGVLIGLACRALTDEDGAELELAAARDVFERLGAAVDLERLRDLSPAGLTSAVAGPTATADGLTPREVEVLRLVATGRTNRAVAEDLRISEKTVARHVSNIFAKLGVPSRSAATAYAYEHGLV